MIRKTKIEQAAIALLASLPASDPAKGLREAIEAKYPGAVAKAKVERRKARFEAKFAGNPPAWVKRLVAKHAPEISRLRWRRSRTKWTSSGRCWPYAGEIVITQGAGTGRLDPATGKVVRTHDEDEDRYVVLHEIAHLKGGHHHDDRFWTEFYRLLIEEGLYRKALQMPWGTRSLRAAASRTRKTRQKGT